MRTTIRTAGFSLVVCLIILTLLSILVVSLISSATLDRVTSRAFANKAGAELAADTAVNQAISLLAETITQFPDSATVWEPLTPPTASKYTAEGTVLYYHDKPPRTPNTAPDEPEPKRFLLPLVSRGADASGQLPGSVPIEEKDTALGAEPWDDTNTVDLNRPRFNGDRDGWIGTPPPPAPSTSEPTTPKPFRAKWIEVKEHTNKVTNSGTPRVISRYAFWIEDESFKVNLNQLGATKRGAEIDSPGFPGSPGAVASEVPIQGLIRSARAPIDRDTAATQARNLRDGFFGKRLLDLPSFNQPDLQWDADGKPRYLGDGTKFLATIFSGGLNLSRHGSQRLNLNGLGFDNAAATNQEIQKGIKQVVETIRHHVPNFHQRFYRLQRPADADYKINDAKAVATAHQDPYLYKIAANIRDYIDPDLQPTMITNMGTVAPKAAPLSAFGDDGEIMWAQGKEGLYLQEAAVRERITTTKTNYTLKLDYYVEFWNMTNRDIYAMPVLGTTEPHALGGSPYVCIANQQRWLARKDGSELTATNSPAGNPIQGPERDMVIDIANGVFHNGQAMPSGVVFKAGQCTVITTDPDYQTVVQVAGGGSPNFSGVVNVANTYYCSVLKAGKREYLGPIPGPWTATTGGIKPDFRDGSEDYDTEVILGNNSGYIDSLPCAIAMGGSPVVTNNESDQHWYGGTLLGNGTTSSQLGDPRTNNEPLNYTRFISGGSIGEPDQARYFNTTSKPRFSLGHPNDRYVGPQNNKKTLPLGRWTTWPDYYKGWDYPQNNASYVGTGNATNPSEQTAPAFYADAKLESIGQLGDVFDPARVAGNVGSLGIGGARGGGRTLKIGQKDDLVDTTTVDAKSQQWAAWRLTDFLGTTSDLELPGLININGLRRDNGAALRAACYGLTLNSVSWPIGSANPTITPAKEFDSEEYEDSQVKPGLQLLINQAIERLKQTDITKPSYFRERGEFSDLEAYSKTVPDPSKPDLVAGVQGSDAFDRPREELYRRLSNLITTRGNIFSVYAVGQSIQELNDAAKTQRVTGQHAVKVTFALLPKKADGTDFRTKQESFDPTDEGAVQDRFLQPAYYDVLFLQVTPQ